MKLIIGLSTLYFLPAFLMWLHLKIAHSKGGKWENVNTCTIDFIICTVPILNIIGMLIAWILFYPKNRPNDNFNWFFGIKK